MIHPRWTEELKTAVAAMIISGMSYSQIGAEIGRNRNAISGIISRNPELVPAHLKPKAGGSRPARVKPTEKRVYARQPFKPKIALPVFDAPTEAPVSLRRTVLEIEARECRAPTGGEGAALVMCGHQALNIHGYCAFHHVKLHIKREPKGKAA